MIRILCGPQRFSKSHPVLITILVEPKLWAEQIPRPYERAEENARSLYGHFGMTRWSGLFSSRLNVPWRNSGWALGVPYKSMKIPHRRFNGQRLQRQDFFGLYVDYFFAVLQLSFD